MRIPKRFRAVRAAEVSPDASLRHLADAICSGNGGVFEITMTRNDDCPKLAGGECNCTPDIRPGPPQRKGRN